MKTKVAITSTTKPLSTQADQLAKQLSLPRVTPETKDYPYLLVFTETRIELHFPQNKNYKPFYIDFSHGPLGYRLQHAQGRSELIAKAVGIKKDYRPFVIDCTAGLGKDGFLLARLGCKVIMIEQSSLLFTLVNNALSRFHSENPALTEKLNLKFLNCNSLDYLNNLKKDNSPEVIYLDPMFPEREKSAKIKKEMQILQDLIGENQNALELFDLAMKKAKNRVVVKRPIHAETIDSKKPNLVYKGKSTRFDVYTVRT